MTPHFAGPLVSFCHLWWAKYYTQLQSACTSMCRHIYSRTIKRLLLTDCTPNKILYRTIANLRIFVINALILTLSNDKLPSTHILIKVLLITVIFLSQVMTSKAPKMGRRNIAQVADTALSTNLTYDVIFRYFSCLWVSLRVSFYLYAY